MKALLRHPQFRVGAGDFAPIVPGIAAWGVMAGAAAVAAFALPLKLNILVAIAAAVAVCLMLEKSASRQAPEPGDRD